MDPPRWPEDGPTATSGAPPSGAADAPANSVAAAVADEPPLDVQTVAIKLPAAEIARAALVLVALGLGLFLLWTVHKVVFLLFLGILLATAIEPLVNRLRRGPFSRGSGVLVVYTGIVLVLGLPLMLFAPGLFAQVDRSVSAIPESIANLRPSAEQLRPQALKDIAISGIDRVADSVRNPAAPEPENLLELAAATAEGILEFITVFFLAFYWLIERATIKRAVLRLVPRRRAKDVNAVWLEVEQKLGGWVRGQILVMAVMGTMAGIGFYFIGLPNPFLLAIFAALGELIPIIGPLLGFAPAVIVALMIDPYTALIVLAYALVIQQLESNILVPRVMGHTVGVSPLTVVLGILIGSILYGLPGAFLAIPVSGAVQVIVVHVLGMEESAQAEAHVPGPSRAAAQESAPPAEPRKPDADTPIPAPVAGSPSGSSA